MEDVEAALNEMEEPFFMEPAKRENDPMPKGLNGFNGGVGGVSGTVKKSDTVKKVGTAKKVNGVNGMGKKQLDKAPAKGYPTSRRR